MRVCVLCAVSAISDSVYFQKYIRQYWSRSKRNGSQAQEGWIKANESEYEVASRILPVCHVKWNGQSCMDLEDVIIIFYITQWSVSFGFGIIWHTV